MYAYTARAGSSCQHIRASCRQCAISRLRSIAPRLLRQSSLLSPTIPLTIRSYSSQADPLAAWLDSVKSKKCSEPQQLTPSSGTSSSKPVSISTGSKHARNGRADGRGDRRIRRVDSAKPTKPQEEDLVQALKVIANALSKSKANNSDGSSSKPPPTLVDPINHGQKQKPTKFAKTARREAENSGNRKQRREPPKVPNAVKIEAEHLDISPSKLAAALGRKSSPPESIQRPVEAAQATEKLEETRGSAHREGPQARRRRKRLEREQNAQGANNVEGGVLKDDTNSTLRSVSTAKGWLQTGQVLDGEKTPQTLETKGDLRKTGVEQEADPRDPAKAPTDGPTLRRIAGKISPMARRMVSAGTARDTAMEEFRKRAASRVSKTPPVIPRPRGREPSSNDSSARRTQWRAQAVGPLLQNLYNITHSVATTQAQRLLLQFLEENHELLGEHGDKLIDAQRGVAVFGTAPDLSSHRDGTLQTTLMETYQTLEDALKVQPAKPAESIPEMALKKATAVGEISASELNLKPIDVPQPPVPGVVYGLDRVLFNPGVYQLRDEHSKVYNFDPYLETITPVKEFDFSALKEYITSSRDTALINIATQENTKYTGSTSSMTSALAHFHYLLSKWRPINMNHLSRGFPDPLTSFSAFQREPTGIFLRWRDGVYAIDANKEFDSANVLMYLGKSMEKFLTAERDVYEKFRKDQSHKLSDEEKDTPESYHYTTMGDFLMRSQLDAYDPRLPGTGMFDLKTRAVVSIRKDATDFEPGLGYEIRKRKGEFESFEREYYDLCRAAFMKYSLQARMGRMDGIFVAFHNIERIFGFQYLPIGAMDEAIHGTTDTTLGDQEFKVSVSMLNKALDMFTEKFPAQSLQIDFETRPLNTKKDDCFMYIIAQPVTEDKIKSIQERNLEKIQEYERQVVGLDSKQTAQFLIDAVNKETEEAELMDDAERLQKAIEHPFEPRNVEILKAAVEKMSEHDTATENAVHKALEMVEARLQEEGELATPAASAPESPDIAEDSSAESSNAETSAEANPDVTETTANTDESTTSTSTSAPKPARKKTFDDQPIMGLKIQIRNFVNGKEVLRVENLRPEDNWEVKYAIEDMKYEQALSRYQEMKARKFLVHVTRKKKGLKDVESGNGRMSKHQNQFLGAISDAVKAGKQYRAQQDAVDAERGLTSLADTGNVFEPVKADEVEIRTGGLAIEEKEVPKQAEEVIFTKEAQEPPMEETAQALPQEEVKKQALIPEAARFVPQSEIKQEVPQEETKADYSKVEEFKVDAEKPKEEAKPEPPKEEVKEKSWWLL